MPWFSVEFQEDLSASMEIQLSAKLQPFLTCCFFPIIMSLISCFTVELNEASLLISTVLEDQQTLDPQENQDVMLNDSAAHTIVRCACNNEVISLMLLWLLLNTCSTFAASLLLYE